MPTGLDRLAGGADYGLAGRRVALLCNHTAVDARGHHAVEVLRRLADVDVVRLLGPEHGVWSTHQDMEAVEADGQPDAVFGIPEVSLYGDKVETLRADAPALHGVDAVVYDIRDIGTRFYTYAATLAFAMETAAAMDIPVWVLDRPNPLGSAREGPLLRPGFESFCGIEPGLPIRHGMTVGELARWYGRRRAPGCEVHVVPCDDEDRSPWVPPSPNMPTLDTAVVYPGMCLLEATTLSEGRGTTTPFLLFGAPGIDAQRLVGALRERELPGVDFVPRVFRPMFQKHGGAVCTGVTIRVLDPAKVHATNLGVHVLDVLGQVAPEVFGWRQDAYEFVEDVPAIDLLWGSPALREVLESRADIMPLLASAQAEAESFAS